MLQTGLAARLAARTGALAHPTSGLAPSYLQANLVVLPARHAADFRLLCARNPVPCPLLAESQHPGSATALRSHLAATGVTGATLAADIDLRRDAPRYRVYRDGELVAEKADVAAEWADDHVGFLIGCSYSFEAALAAAGLAPRHVVQQRNVAMYRTAVPLAPAGVFTGATVVVSMRPYRPEHVGRVREVTRPFGATHGEPLAWGWEALAQLGIGDLARPEWGDVCLTGDGRRAFCRDDSEGFVPVFWGCGVTPQEAVMRAGLEGTVMGHAPGHMIVLDVRDHEVFPGLVGSGEVAEVER
ncbi:hypothetical protein B0H67DRAFT_497183 [Lasiosphaeris hirsuta]|uniref:Hydro-lyase n=1 Tax=Lasiosphaeris hirsuta TaxID=260670 RepID=A0AA39ZXZ7_9PEZI|nr:hypothetical protein B0H67DRAFT_497183 [Lasiosphaeris hirsuta]